MGSTPKAPKISSSQLAFERAQQTAIGKEISDENRRRKALIRGQLGVASLLSGLPGSSGTPIVGALPSTNSSPANSTGVLTGANIPVGSPAPRFSRGGQR